MQRITHTFSNLMHLPKRRTNYYLSMFQPSSNVWFWPVKPTWKCLKPAFDDEWPAGGDSTGCKKKYDCIEVYEKMSLLLNWFFTSVNWFQMILWSLRERGLLHETTWFDLLGYWVALWKMYVTVFWDQAATSNSQKCWSANAEVP